MLFLQKCLTTVNQHVGAFVISTVSYVAAEIGEHINKLAKINSTKNDAEAFALNYFTKRWNQNIALRLRMSQYEQSKDILSWDSYKCIFVTGDNVCLTIVFLGNEFVCCKTLYACSHRIFQTLSTKGGKLVNIFILPGISCSEGRHISCIFI